MKICLIAYHFPPLNAIGAWRPLRLANYAAEQGHEVTVICASLGSVPRYYRVDHELAARIHPAVRVVRVPALRIFDRLLDLKDKLDGMRGKRPDAAAGAGAPAAAKRPAGGRTSSPLRKLAGVLFEKIQRPFQIPDSEAGFIPAGFIRYLMAYGIGRPDRLYVTGPPWSPVVLANLLSKAFRLPLTIDYRDPWNLNPYDKASASPLRISMERSAVKQARSVIFSTEGIRGQYREAGWIGDFAARTCAIYNGIDEALVTEVAAAKQAPGGASASASVDIVHAGTLYPFRMPAELADFLAGSAAEPVAGKKLLYSFVGAQSNPHLQSAFSTRSALDHLEFPGKVSAHEAKVALARADILLVLQLGTKIQLPAKVFECALIGKPVLCFAEADSETARFIREYGLGEVLAPPYSESAASVIGRLLARSGTDGSGLERIKAAFRGAEIAKRMLDVLGRARSPANPGL